MTLCTSIDTLAMTYLDDELADEELREFELHLIDCAACRGRVEADREAIADLRKRLAPPPMPDLVRARVRAALDAEDAATAQAEGGRRWTGWILPGTATVAAVAALAMFVLLREPAPSKPPAAAVITANQRQAPQVFEVANNGALPMPEGIEIQLHRAAQWQEAVADREVTKYAYSVRFARGIQIDAWVASFETRGLDMHVGRQIRANGLVLWLTEYKGQMLVAYEGPGGMGYVFGAPELGARDLVDLVANYLVDDVGAR